MLCNNCKLVHATRRVWCPTWITAFDGPISCCDKCSEVFIEDKNPSAKDGQFFWELDAQIAFNSVEQWFKVNDPRTENAIGMLLGKFSSHIAGCFDPRDKFVLHDNGFYICDGKVWMMCGVANNCWVCRFGDVNEFKQRFP